MTLLEDSYFQNRWPIITAITTSKIGLKIASLQVKNFKIKIARDMRAIFL